MQHVVAIDGERRKKPGRGDIALGRRITGSDERRGGREQHGEGEHSDPERGPAVAQQAVHRARPPCRMRGSAKAARASATRFPTTTSTALTLVAASTTG